MRRKIVLFAPIMLCMFGLLFFNACSIKQMALNSMSDTIAPNPEKKLAEAIVDDPKNPVLALTGESDIKIVAEVMPVIVKMYEILQIQNPQHRGLTLMTGALYVMYANAFVQTPADFLPEEQYLEKNKQYMRAKKFYRRGAKFVLDSLDLVYSGCAQELANPSNDADYSVLEKMKKHDVESLYWAGAGILGAFALDPMDIEVVDRVPGAVAMLEKAVQLDPGFNQGAVWEVLTAFYAAAPETLGGGFEKAETAYKQALYYSNGKSPSVFVTYATVFCIPSQDGKAFDTHIRKALEINPDTVPSNRLMIVLAQEKARWLKENKGIYFLEH